MTYILSPTRSHIRFKGSHDRNTGVDCHCLLQEVKRKKAGLKLNIKKTKIMASGPITSWEKVEAVTDFILGSSKVTTDGD